MKSNPKKTDRKKSYKKPENGLIASIVFFAFAGYLTLISPIINTKEVLDITLMPRLLGLSIFLLGMTFVFYWQKYFIPKYNVVFGSVPFLLMVGYLAVIVVTSQYAILPEEGFFEFNKMVTFLIMMAFATILFMQHPDWASKIAPLFALGGMIAVALSLQQYSEKVLTNSTGMLSDGRDAIYAVEGLMSHKNELSTYLMMTMPLLVYAVYRLRLIGQWLSGIALAAVIFMILLLKTRAVWLGIAMAGMMAAVVIIFYTKRLGLPIFLRYFFASGIVLAFSGLFYVVKILPPAEDTFSTVGRIQSTFDPNSPANVHRVNMWGSTVRMIKDNPWLGVGSGNWRISYYPYIEGVFDNENQVNWARPHNDFLWMLAEKGIGGAIFYIAFFLTIFFLAWRVIVKAVERHHAVLAIILASGVLGYLVVGVFSFPSERIDHQINLAIFCAGILALYYETAKSSAGLKIPAAAIAIPVAFLLMFATYYAYSCVQQEKHLRAVNNALALEQWDTIIKESELSRNPMRTIDNISNPPDSYIAFACYKLKRFDEGLAAIEKAMEAFPNNPKLIQYKALFLFEKGRFEESQELIQQVLKILPRSEQNLANSAAAYYKMGQFQNAVDTEKKIPGWESKQAVVNRVNYLTELIKKEGPVGKPPVDAPAAQ